MASFYGFAFLLSFYVLSVCVRVCFVFCGFLLLRTAGASKAFWLFIVLFLSRSGFVSFTVFRV